VPTCVPNEFLTSKLGDYGVKVKQIGNDYDRHDGLMSNVRVAVVECRDVNRIPDTLPWIFEGMTGRALVFVQGRPPRCHRCGDRSHKVAQCTAARSYASAAREEADDELEMDDQETEESTSVTAPQQPTVGESAGQVAATSSEGATAEATEATVMESTEATATATAEVDDGASSMSEGEASDDNDGDEDTSATETEGASATASWAEASAAEFKQPRYAIRRQKRTSKRAAMSASDTNEMPKKIKAPTTTAVKDVEGSVSAAPSTPSTPKDGDDGDPTVRSHSKTRIPTSRRRTQDRDAATSQQ